MLQCGGSVVVIIKEANEIATNDIRKEWGDPTCVELDAWVEDYKSVSRSTNTMG